LDNPLGTRNQSGFSQKFWRILVRLPFRPLVEYSLLGIFFLTCSIPHKVNIGSFSIFPIEMAAFAYLVWRGVWGKKNRRPIPQRETLVLAGFAVLVATSLVIWLVAVNWPSRTDLLWGWIFATLFLAAFLDSARQKEIDWRVVAGLFVICALPNAVTGLLQEAAGGGGRGKGFIGWSWHESLVPISGLFGYANEMAIFQYWPVILSAGLALFTKRLTRIVFSALALVHFLVLFLTVTRTIIAAVVIVVALLGVLQIMKNRKQAAAWLGGGAILAAAVFVAILPFLPARIFSGRFELWSRALKVIFSDPFKLPLGYLVLDTHKIPAFWLPHNIYLYAWLFFGWVGLLLLVALVVFLFIQGWKRYTQMRDHAFARALWLGLVVMLLVNGMASLYLHEIYHVVTFALILAVWMVAWRDVADKSEMDASAAGNSNALTPIPA
jgi:hypothetical protein